jgi:protein-tyrosine phosphatase
VIDIHCHILPDIDDGAPHRQASLQMASLAHSEGISRIIATPHKNGKYENTKVEILDDVSSLNDLLQEEKIPLTIHPGQEPRITGELLEDYEKGDILSLNDAGKYVFVELPSGQVPRYAAQLLFDIQLTGLTPIIVHPERNHEIIEHPDILYKFVKDGTLTQVTSSSITGHFGKKIKKFTEDLIEHNLTHFVASDAHNVSSRPFRLKEAYEAVEETYGIDYRYLFQENAELLLGGNNVAKEVPEQIQKKKFLGLF